MKNKTLSALLLLSLVLGFAGPAHATHNDEEEEEDDDFYTIQELAEYEGKGTITCDFSMPGLGVSSGSIEAKKGRMEIEVSNTYAGKTQKLSIELSGGKLTVEAAGADGKKQKQSVSAQPSQVSNYFTKNPSIANFGFEDCDK